MSGSSNTGKAFSQASQASTEFTASFTFETYRDVKAATAREKQIKGLSRAKKIALIATRNPTWEDLAAEWFARYARKADSSLRSE